MTWHNLRQQNEKPTGNPNLSLADFVAPKDSGVPDYIGAFAVTAGIGIEKRLEIFEKQHDDYNSIMLKALADRLAEAFTELLHARVRREFWGYAKDERLTNDELIAEKYRGIRPAPGYPACPDHTEKGALFELLRRRARRASAHRVVRDVPGLVGERLLSLASGIALLRRRQSRPRPGRRLRAPQEHAGRGGRALARAGARYEPRSETTAATAAAA